MGAAVHPAEVRELRTRLAPAVAALERTGGARAGVARLAQEWKTYTARPVDWLNAPAELERGLALEDRLAELQAGIADHNTGPVRAGEVLGMHTVAELADLVAAERANLATLDAIKPCPAWAAADADGYGKWAADVYDASVALTHACDQAQALVDVTPDMVKNVAPVRVLTGLYDPWQNLVDAARPMVDLVRRFMAAGFCPYPNTTMPQPKAPDFDLGAYKWSDQALKSMGKAAEAVSSAVSSKIPYVVLGVVAGVVVILAIRK